MKIKTRVTMILDICLGSVRHKIYLWNRNFYESINVEDIKGEARLCRYIFEIYDSVYILVLKTEINVIHYILEKGKVHLGKIKLTFRPKREDGQNTQNKLFHII
jgi:hypothetical protein